MRTVCTLLLGCTLFLVGCSTTPPNVAHDTAAALTFGGLTLAGQKAPDTATKAATDIKASIDTAILPYVDQSQGVAYSVLQEAIAVNLTKNLNFVEIFGASFVANAIDKAVNVKNPFVALSAAQMLVLQNCLQGISDGCAEYLTPAAKCPRWRAHKVTFEPTRTKIQIDYPAAEIVELPPIQLASNSSVIATDGSELTMRCKAPRYYAADATQGTGVVTYTRCTRGGCCGGSWRTVYREKPGQIR